jgi:hypothetical protein
MEVIFIAMDKSQGSPTTSVCYTTPSILAVIAKGCYGAFLTVTVAGKERPLRGMKSGSRRQG